MLTRLSGLIFALIVTLPFATARADEYDDAIKAFRSAGQSSEFFSKSFAYAVFPSIGKAGIGIGGAHGSGRVYVKDAYVGDTTMTQVSVGLQLGGQVFREIIFFQDKGVFDRFTAGNFEFGAQANAIAITASASAQASTGGSSAGASLTEDKAKTAGAFRDGTAVFTVAQGGLMYEASLSGQKFSFKPRK